MTRRHLTTTQRRALYNAAVDAAHAAGREHPACNLCPHPILPGQDWDASHDAQIPGWLSGAAPVALAHRRCNRLWNNRHDTPLFAKSNRQRDKFRGIKQSRTPMRAGRSSAESRGIDGQIRPRRTLSEKLVEAGILHPQDIEAGRASDLGE